MTLMMITNMTTLVMMMMVMVCSCFSPIEGVSPDHSYDDTRETTTDFVTIQTLPPNIQSKKRVVVPYYCQTNCVIVLDVLVMVFGVDAYDVTFTKSWRCHGQGNQGNPRFKYIRLKLPHQLVYRPDFFNPSSDVIVSARMRVAMVTEDDFVKAVRSHQAPFTRGTIKRVWDVSSLPPYSRPPLSPPCPTWYWRLVQKYVTLDESKTTCPREQEQVMLLDYPTVLNGNTQGVARPVPPFLNSVLERDRHALYRRPRYSVEVWIYVIDYCPRHSLNLAQVCGIVVHATPTNYFRTPAILINVHGQIQIDVHSPSGHKGVKSLQVLPKHTWVRLAFAMDFRSWTLHVNYGTDLKDGYYVDYSYDEDILYNDTEGYFFLGGIGDSLGSFVGYMGRAVLYRGRILGPHQLALPNPYHPMYELDLTSRDFRCQKFLTWLTTSVKIYTDYHQYTQRLRDDQCPSQEYESLLRPASSDSCPTRHVPREQRYRYVSRLLRRAVFAGKLSPRDVARGAMLAAYGRGGENADGAGGVLDSLSRDVMDRSLRIVTRSGLRKARKVLHLLKQSACLGNDDAMFYLAAMLNSGVGASTDEIQSLAYFMLGTLNGHSLSSMALAFRHSLGLDGAPRDSDVSYMYYKTVADKCRKDRDEHKDSGYHPEKIRLIDERVLKLQTNEVEDLFMWLKDQAAKGVESARSDMAELMYWGKQGVQRNLQNALNVYRQGAQEGDVKSMYNYGLMQLRGIGGKKNATEGAEIMKRAAEQKSPDALNALGWIALEVDKNYTEAHRLFSQAKGFSHPDAGYYIGHMYMLGHIPGSGIDLDRALENMEWSARKNQVHAGTLYSFLLSRGTPKYPRNIVLAGQWARYIAEQNGDLGKPLRHAVDAYRHGNFEDSLFLYLVLAETGLEVASFNLAYLCELNTEGVTSYISKDCQWRQYNLTIQREFKDVDSYSYIKMGDYHWYGCQKSRDLKLAAKFYAYAALKRDPQALFNLAYMVEEGFHIPNDIKAFLGLRGKGINSTYSTLTYLYTRCRESRKSEAYLPCTLALYRIEAVNMWREWCQYFNVASLLGVIVSLVVTLFLLCQWIMMKIRDARVWFRRWRRGRVEGDGVELSGEGEGGEGDVDRVENGRGRGGGDDDDDGNRLPNGLRLRGVEDRV